MMHQIKGLYEFGTFCLDPAERLLLRDNKRVALTSRVFDILTMLVENSGHLLEKDVLMQAIWPDTVVEEGNLTRCVSTLRKALGEGSNGHRYIETVPKRGYRFVAAVKRRGDSSEEMIVYEHTRSSIVVAEERETTDDKNVKDQSGREHFPDESRGLTSHQSTPPFNRSNGSKAQPL